VLPRTGGLDAATAEQSNARESSVVGADARGGFWATVAKRPDRRGAVPGCAGRSVGPANGTV